MRKRGNCEEHRLSLERLSEVSKLAFQSFQLVVNGTPAAKATVAIVVCFVYQETCARCYKASMAVLRYASPYAASGSVKLAHIITTLEGFLRP